MNKYEENVYKNLFEYPTKKIVELELKNEGLEKENQQLENNRDKALKIIESYELGKYDYSIPPGGIIELRDVLRGDSDE